jgi:hypothetical protein
MCISLNPFASKYSQRPFRDDVDDNLERELEQLKTSQGLLGQTSQQMGEQVMALKHLSHLSFTSRSDC